MENLSQPGITTQKTSKRFLKILLFIFLSLIVICGSVFVGIQIGKKLVIGVEPNASTIVTDSNFEWKTGRYFCDFSYEYPAGWHIATIAENNLYGEDSIVINREPIDRASGIDSPATPQGFTISVIPGNNEKAEKLFNELLKPDPENYSDLVQETLDSEIGKIYHWEGNYSDERFKGIPLEHYLFTLYSDIENSDLKSISYIDGVLENNNDPQLSSILKHVILSIKKFPCHQN